MTDMKISSAFQPTTVIHIKKPTIWPTYVYVMFRIALSPWTNVVPGGAQARIVIGPPVYPGG